MIRSELVQKIASENKDLRIEEVERIVDSFFDAIVDQLAAGGRVELRGFGAFSTRSRDSRTGRNPRTGDPVAVQAKNVPYFKPGKEMRSEEHTSELQSLMRKSYAVFCLKKKNKRTIYTT